MAYKKMLCQKTCKQEKASKGESKVNIDMLDLFADALSTTPLLYMQFSAIFYISLEKWHK